MMYATVLIITDETSHTIQIKLELKKKKFLAQTAQFATVGPTREIIFPEVLDSMMES